MTTTLTVRGQTVIPAPIRRAYRLRSSTKLEWVDDGKCIRVVPLKPDTISEARGALGKARLRRAILEAIRPVVTGAPGGTRTPGLQLRRLLLYPVELQAPKKFLPFYRWLVNKKDRHERDIPQGPPADPLWG